MKHLKTILVISIIVSLTTGGLGGYYISYIPMQKEVEHYKYNFEYYREKYLSECEIYEKIMDIASNQQLDDYSKLYIIRSTYIQPGRSQEIHDAVKLKKSFERKKLLNEN